MSGISKAFKHFGVGGGAADRTEVDLDFKKILIAIGVMSLPMFWLYYRFSASLGGAVLLTVVMLVLGFLFSAVAGYLVGLIGSSAPQAGLMALMAKGIVGGEMAWPLVLVGMFLAIGLILIESPSPMLIAVGMYLPFESTAAIFVGGVVKWILDEQLAKRGASAEERTRAENTGTLLSSGFIAGEALMAVVLAFVVLGANFLAPSAERVLPFISANPLLGSLAFIALAYGLVAIPLKASKQAALPAASPE